MLIVIFIFVFLIWRNTRRINIRVIGPVGRLVQLIAGLGLIAIIGFVVINLTGHAP